MGSHEQTVIGLESRAISAGVTKQFVTIFSKTCVIMCYIQIFVVRSYVIIDVLCIQPAGVIFACSLFKFDVTSLFIQL